MRPRPCLAAILLSACVGGEPEDADPVGATDERDETDAAPGETDTGLVGGDTEVGDTDRGGDTDRETDTDPTPTGDSDVADTDTDDPIDTDLVDSDVVDSDSDRVDSDVVDSDSDRADSDTDVTDSDLLDSDTGAFDVCAWLLAHPEPAGSTAARIEVACPVPSSLDCTQAPMILTTTARLDRAFDLQASHPGAVPCSRFGGTCVDLWGVPRDGVICGP